MNAVEISKDELARIRQAQIDELEQKIQQQRIDALAQRNGPQLATDVEAQTGERKPPFGENAVGVGLSRLLATMRQYKPNDRSERDRYWAICITDLEKVKAVFDAYILKGE